MQPTPMPTSTRRIHPRPVTPQASESVPELVSGILGDTRDLMVIHADRARLEIRDELSELGKATRWYIGASAILASALILLVNGLALGLAYALEWPAWATYTICGVVAALVGVLVLRNGRKHAAGADLIPEQTLHDLQRDAKWIAEEAKDIVH